jgi:hypothetical protein
MTVTLKSRPDLVDLRSLTDRWRIRRDTRGLMPDPVPPDPRACVRMSRQGFARRRGSKIASHGDHHRMSPFFDDVNETDNDEEKSMTTDTAPPEAARRFGLRVIRNDCLNPTTMPQTIPPETDHEIPRWPPQLIAKLRSTPGTVASRWLARLFTWGETMHTTGAFGVDDAPVIVRVGSECGPGLAATCVGIPVNRALRPEDHVRCHLVDDGKNLRGFHPEMLVGVVEDAWPDEYGIMGTLLLFNGPGHEDLATLEAGDALWCAQFCLVKNTTATLWQTPWQTFIADATSARGISLDFSSHPLALGSRVLRRLALDEDPDKNAAPPPVPLRVPPGWHGVPMKAPEAHGDIAPGAISTGKVATNAITQSGAASYSAYTENSTTPSDVTGATFTFTATGGIVMLEVSATLRLENTGGSAQNLGGIVSLLRDGTVIKESMIYLSGMAAGQVVIAPADMSIGDNPTAASHTYKLQLRRHGAAGADCTVQLAGEGFGRMKYAELKR